MTLSRQDRLEMIRGRVSRKLEWWYRRITWHHRVLPDFMIIGAPRSGTTTVFELLADHPQVLPSFRKEVHFFDYRHELGVPWYRAHFPLAAAISDGLITGDATPNYLGFPDVPQRVESLLPDVKLVALLRNPSDRAYSGWQLKVREGIEQLPFDQAIAAEEERLRETGRRKGASRRYAYLGKSRYAEQLEAWFELFPRHQFLILRSEDLFAGEPRVLSDLSTFLGVRDFRLEQTTNVPQANASPESSDMDPAIRHELEQYFRPHNQRLYDLIGRDLGWG